MYPKVSIIIAAYNAEKYLSFTLKSLLKQTWKNIEIVIVNDGSTDSTASIIENYRTADFKVVHQHNLGQNKALNLGFKISTGEFIKFMDADDIINAVMIEFQVKKLKNLNNYVAYGEWARFYDDKPEEADFTPLENWKNMEGIDFLITPPQGPMLQCGIMLIPRNLIEVAGNWNEELLLYNDTEFFTRLLLKSKGIVFTKGAKLYYRSGAMTNLSSQKTRKYFQSTFLATSLIAEHITSIENSERVRKLISHMYLIRYQDMYPNFPDLGKMHEKMIKKYGVVKYNQGGKLTQLCNNIFGWKIIKRVKHLLLHK